jgi:hypothetical protein
MEKREFKTGAWRDTEEGKIDFEGFMHPLVIKKFGEYMTKNRKMKDGSLRDSDNWQKGIPKDVYMKSLWRHMHDLWLHHRGYPEESRESIDDAICGVLFNSMGYYYEILKK